MTESLSKGAQAVLRRLQGPSGGTYWVTPAESQADSWVLVAPLRLRDLMAVRKVREETITELVRAGYLTWTAADENVPEYTCGSLTREAWWRGRKGRRIVFVPGSE